MTLFANHGRNTRIGKRRAPIANRAAARRALATFGDAIAEGASLTAAGRVIGVGQQRASQMFAQMRAELGWQAR